jgi:hypothetical protein
MEDLVEEFEEKARKIGELGKNIEGDIAKEQISYENTFLQQGVDLYEKVESKCQEAADKAAAD